MTEDERLDAAIARYRQWLDGYRAMRAMFVRLGHPLPSTTYRKGYTPPPGVSLPRGTERHD